MKKSFLATNLVISFLIVFVFQITPVLSQNYPEFTGNYVECSTNWCTLEAYELATLSLFQDLSDYPPYNKGSMLVVYTGFFEIPNDVPGLNTKKPRILLYSGRYQADPRTTALVQLERMPFNNQPIDQVNGKNYHQKVTYSRQNMKNQLWTFKKEIVLRFKPIEGKIGMFLYEPAEPLEDGFYVVDSGIAAADGHSGLNSIPQVLGLYSLAHVQVVMPFVIGDKKELAKLGNNGKAYYWKPPIEYNGTRFYPRENVNKDIQDNNSTNAATREEEKNTQTNNIKTTIDNFINGIFGGKK